MKKTDIELIIKKGSIRQKIKLFFTDIAFFNISGIYTAEFKGSGDNLRLEVKDYILTDRERDLIIDSVKDPKDIKYYNDLIIWNRGFLIFKDKLTVYKNYFKYISGNISSHCVSNSTQHSFIEVINNIFEDIKDKNLREKLINKTIKDLKFFNAYKYQEKGYEAYIDIKYFDFDGLIDSIEVLNNKTKEAKEWITTLKSFLNKVLPLQPYKDFVKYEEDQIKAVIEKCRIDTKKYIVSEKFKDQLEKINILRWEDVEIKVSDEDIEDIKNAGI